jgi:hypothetical protein
MVWFLGTNNIAVTTKLKQVKLEELLGWLPIEDEDAVAQVNTTPQISSNSKLKIFLC